MHANALAPVALQSAPDPTWEAYSDLQILAGFGSEERGIMGGRTGERETGGRNGRGK